MVLGWGSHASCREIDSPDRGEQRLRRWAARIKVRSADKRPRRALHGLSYERSAARTSPRRDETVVSPNSLGVCPAPLQALCLLGLVKRSPALQACNRMRNSQADGVPRGTRLRRSNHASGVFFLSVAGVHALKTHPHPHQRLHAPRPLRPAHLRAGDAIGGAAASSAEPRPKRLTRAGISSVLASSVSISSPTAIAKAISRKLWIGISATAASSRM